ncbi:hypothetical protein RRG08_028454 [Elysia crispata]|uniref:Uncharacterized protein n=1 Tax=Elysia crispata TaxID=231223 RepID=A0AAE1AUJ3_9GAST|nr:hypothetical protein RRG08_028454 [Elysia crispata]
MAEANFRLPYPLNLAEGNLSEQYKKWQRQVEIYMEASCATSKPPKTQAAIILHCAGPQALEVFDQLNFEDEGKKDLPEVVYECLKNYCYPRTNEVLQTFSFSNIPASEPFDTFLTE